MPYSYSFDLKYFIPTKEAAQLISVKKLQFVNLSVILLYSLLRSDIFGALLVMLNIYDIDIL